MKILYCKTFGIGNAVMAVPAIKALVSMGHQVDALVGSLPDDMGAFHVFTPLRDSGLIGKIYFDRTDMSVEYDVAILAIPYDGRWGPSHFRAKQVIDGRTRPDPSTTGFVSWKKHEVEYQMDNVRALGFSGETPDCSFLPPEVWALRPRIFYVGVGYKKDPAGFWKKKHWGNENFAKLVRLILDDHKMNLVLMTGDMGDLTMSINPILNQVRDTRAYYVPGNISESFKTVSRCGYYVGNDTGMMHVAASCGRNVVGIFQFDNTVVKNHPWCKNWKVLDASKEPVTPDQVMQALKEMPLG